MIRCVAVQIASFYLPQVVGCGRHRKSPLTACRDSPFCLGGNRTNPDFCRKKFAENVDRDKLNLRELAELGYRVLVVWECETKDAEALEAKLRVSPEKVREETK